MGKYALCLLAEASEVVTGVSGSVDVDRISSWGKNRDTAREGSECGISIGGEESGERKTMGNADGRKATSWDVSRLLLVHRTVKYNRIDEALSYLGWGVLDTVAGDLEKLEWLVKNFKEEANIQPYEELTRERALAVLGRCPDNIVQDVQRTFGISEG